MPNKAETIAIIFSLLVITWLLLVRMPQMQVEIEELRHCREMNLGG